jgi:PAS domain S-box-containing protein
MLQSIDPRGRLIRVSQYWTEALGYDREEVVGRKFTDFLTPASSRKARRRVLPQVFAGGLCKDVSFEFVKKNGQVIDVLFSASAERGRDGAITRSLAVLMDITQRRRTELELKRAQEKLSNYSKDLERQVRERTREITGFLQYTPAVVYMKDARGRYILVNSRHEELFGAPSEQVRGKTVHDIFPKEFADRFRANDLRVLHEKRPHHTEELIPLGDQIRHYLSVRFPILDEEGRVIRLCGISVDITDIKQAQEQLRRLSGGIMAAQEKSGPSSPGSCTTNWARCSPPCAWTRCGWPGGWPGGIRRRPSGPWPCAT